MECPKWFQCISLIIVYDIRGQVLLGKRREGKVEGGKWGVLGGSGAFPESEDPWHFAWRELVYDITLPFAPNELRLWRRAVAGDAKKCVLTDIFAYRLVDGIALANQFNPEAPEAVWWFPLREIKEMGERREIAFDNAALLLEFGREGGLA